MIIYLDTETTGLRPGKICQLSYLIQSGNKIREKNFFFSVDYVESGALAVHGFSVPRLKALSKGKKFCDFCPEIERDFNDADLIVSHNTSFDFMFLDKEFSDCGRVFPREKGFCSMKNSVTVCKLSRNNHKGYKYPKLSELCGLIGVKDDYLLSKTEEYFEEKCGYHDARFDTTAVCIACNLLMNSCEQFSILKDYL